ncbi:MAG: IclR family transcriptional regulator [Caulobacteraceae bacterium]|nr:IclR family transcriptional regulator [Caulobacteraceae bacterium]
MSVESEDRSAAGFTGPRAMSRVLRLFSLLSAEPHGLSLAELSEKLDSPKSTLLNSLRPLEVEGFLLSGEGRYRLGPRVFRLAAQITMTWSLPRLARPYLSELAAATGETATLSVLHGDRFLVIEAIETANPVRYALVPGASAPLHAGAAGRVLLAFQEEAVKENYLSHAKMQRYTEHTVVDPEVLRAQLAVVRRSKSWTALGERNIDGAGIASPVFGPKGDIVAALGISLPAVRLRGRENELREVVLKLAAAASGQDFGSE